MDSGSLDRMRARARAVRARAQVRAWQYRQRHLAAGVWFRSRRLLADAKAAYVIADDDAARLLAEGYEAAACGHAIAPPKTILFVDESRLARVDSRVPIPVDLGPGFLTASAVALVKFEERDRSGLTDEKSGVHRI